MSRLFSGTPLDRPTRCEHCGKLPADCWCVRLPPKQKMGEREGKRGSGSKPAGYTLTPENSNPPKDQVARISVEKRKGDRTVTIISGLDHPANDLPKLCTELKTAVGSGGSVQGRTIEIQGEHASAAKILLEDRSMKTRLV